MSGASTKITRVRAGLTIAAVVAGSVWAAALPASAVPAGPPTTPRSAVVGSVTVPTGGDPWATISNLAIDTAHGTLYALQSGTDRSLALIDTASRTVATSIPLTGLPDDVAVDTDRGLAYVSTLDVNAQTGSLLVFDTATRTLKATIALGAFSPSGGNGSAGIAIDSSTGSVYVAGSASAPGLRVLTAAQIAQAIAGTTVTAASIDLPSGTTVSVAVDAAGGTVQAIGSWPGGAALYVFDASSGALVRTVPLTGRPNTMAIDASTGTAYVGLASTGASSIAIVPRGAASVSATILTPAGVQSLAVDADAKTLYAAVGQPFEGGTVNDLLTIDLTSKATVSTVPLPTPADVAVDPQTATAYVSGANAGNTTISIVRSLGVGRVSGSDRFATSVAVSKTEFPGTAPVVYVASGLGYADALSAGPAATTAGGPLLLTPPTALTAEVKAEITRLAPTKVVVVGGTASVSDAVMTQLRAAAPGATVTRAAGPDRFATSLAVVSAAFTTAHTVYLASGANFPDALSAGAVAGAKGVPLVLVNGAATAIDTPTADLLSSLDAKNVVVVGGTAAVSESLAAALAHSGLTVTRNAGSDRYATAGAVNAAAYTHASTAILATGFAFPDALSATTWAGSTSSPIYLAPGSCVPRAVLADFGRLGTTTVTLVGGPTVLTEAVAKLTACGW